MKNKAFIYINSSDIIYKKKLDSIVFDELLKKNIVEDFHRFSIHELDCKFAVNVLYPHDIKIENNLKIELKRIALRHLNLESIL